MRDRRRIAWLIERCLRSKPAQRRVWSVVSGYSYHTRKEGLGTAQHLTTSSERYLFRCAMYWPVVRKEKAQAVLTSGEEAAPVILSESDIPF